MPRITQNNRNENAAQSNEENKKNLARSLQIGMLGIDLEYTELSADYLRGLTSRFSANHWIQTEMFVNEQIWFCCCFLAYM